MACVEIGGASSLLEVMLYFMGLEKEKLFSKVVYVGEREGMLCNVAKAERS